MNAYLVTDSEGVYVIVAADNRRDALRMYPTDEPGEHCRLLERDIEGSYGDITFEYQRTRGVDLILSGVIEPCWRCRELDASFDDYRTWNGFTSAPVFSEITR